MGLAVPIGQVYLCTIEVMKRNREGTLNVSGNSSTIEGLPLGQGETRRRKQVNDLDSSWMGQTSRQH